MSTGYGLFCKKLVHRRAWFLAAGEWPPDDMDVLHTCDDPPCVRNDEQGTYQVEDRLLPRWGHLFLGTNADNIADRVAKKRGQRGERSPLAKLTNQQAAALRSEYIYGHGFKALATKYGVAPMTAYHIISGRTYQDATVQPETPSLPASAIDAA